jgi:hypothetical protein
MISAWTNQRILHEFLLPVVEHIYRVAELSIEGVREAAANENPNRLKDRLVELQVGLVADVFSYIDGASGPTDWPGIKLVNAETGESLSDNLAWDLSHVEGEFLLTTGSSLREE